MNKMPPARTSDIVVQDLGKEILVYDLVINKAFCLNETTSIVFRYCDNKSDIHDVKLLLKDFTDEVIFLALDLLKENNLLQNPDYKIPLEDVSRRELIKKVGLMSLVALPMISTVIAPTSTMAASGALSCGGTIAPNTTTEWVCNFAPNSGGNAEWCNNIACNLTEVSHRCQSCVAKARATPGNRNLFVCYCN